MADVAQQVAQPTTDLGRLKKLFDEARDLTQTARTESQKDLDYYDGVQWTPSELAELAKRKQPGIVINRIKPAVNGMLGVIQRGKSEPVAYPRTPKDEGSSDIATDALRFIADYNRFDQLKLRCFKDMLTPGTMAAQVLVDADLQVTIEQIRWEEFFYDPRARREDFEDARYLGVAKWMYADDVARLYPAKKDEIEVTMNAGAMTGVSDTFQDRPSDGIQWVDPRRRRLLVVELYEREGKAWRKTCFTAGAVLADGPSDYHDDKGVPTCPIVACSAYVDRENNRYGAVRDMRGPQDEINHRRSKSVHFAGTRQIQETALGSGMGNADEARREAARPDGVIPSGWQIVPTQDMQRQQLELMQEAKSEIERLGPNPAILGREGTDSSGRALLARQQSGMVELAILFGHLEDWELRIYRQCWARVRQFWTEPQWIRVTDDEGAPQFLQLNEPIPGPPQVVMGEGGMPTIQPTVLGYKNKVAELDVDIIIDSTPDTANVQQEQFQDLMQLVGSNPNYAQSVPFEMLLELSTIPHKRDLLDKLKQAREQAMQQQAQGQQVAMAEKTAEIEKTNSEAALNKAKATSEMLNGATAHVSAMMGPAPQPPQSAAGF